MPQNNLFDEIREATAFVVANADDVKINNSMIEEVSLKLKGKPSKDWNHTLKSRLEKLSIEDEMRVTVAVGLVNARYWRTPKWETKTSSGSLLLLELYIKAAENNLLWSSKMRCEDYQKIIDIGNGVELPRWKDRYEILVSGVKVFEQQFGGKVLKMLEAHSFDAQKITLWLLDNFKNLSDIHEYKGHQVPLCKLLQVTLIGLHSVLLNRGRGKISGIEKLTALADYKIPQILRHFGVLQYSDRLAKKVDNTVEIVSGSPEEIEIRASMIQAVEKISKKQGALPIETNESLWLMAKDVKDMKPHHRTDALFY